MTARKKTKNREGEDSRMGRVPGTGIKSYGAGRCTWGKPGQRKQIEKAPVVASA